MSFSLRFRIPLIVVVSLFTLPCTLPLHALTPAPAAGFVEPVADASALAEMEAQAARAEPRERCFLYTELLHEWTEVAGRSLAEGDALKAAEAIQHADANAARLKEAINRDSKRLKNAELLLDHSVHRLGDMLRASSMDQRGAFQAVLRHVSAVHDDLLAAVFAH